MKSPPHQPLHGPIQRLPRGHLSSPNNEANGAISRPSSSGSSTFVSNEALKHTNFIINNQITHRAHMKKDLKSLKNIDNVRCKYTNPSALAVATLECVTFVLDMICNCKISTNLN